MTIVLGTTWIFGVGVGYIQGAMDPVNHMTDGSILSKLSSEVQFSACLGLVVGSISACSIWLIRSYEIAGRGRNTLEKQLNYDSLNFDDTEETASERYSFIP